MPHGYEINELARNRFPQAAYLNLSFVLRDATDIDFPGCP